VHEKHNPPFKFYLHPDLETLKKDKKNVNFLTCFFHGNIHPDIRCIRHIPLSLESEETGLLPPQRLASVPVSGCGTTTAGVAGTAEVHHR
jgi:hypothetical protein